VTHPPPYYYSYKLATSTHLFMRLDKFISGCFHQFRSQMRYIATHQVWNQIHHSLHCPRYQEEEENISQALIHCSQSGSARLEFIPEFKSMEDIFLSPTITDKVVSYLRTTKTCSAPQMSSWFQLSPSADLDQLSDVLSNCSEQDITLPVTHIEVSSGFHISSFCLSISSCLSAGFQLKPWVT
jgi:hypothetical protein